MNKYCHTLKQIFFSTQLNIYQRKMLLIGTATFCILQLYLNKMELCPGQLGLSLFLCSKTVAVAPLKTIFLVSLLFTLRIRQRSNLLCYLQQIILVLIDDVFLRSSQTFSNNEDMFNTRSGKVFREFKIPTCFFQLQVKKSVFWQRSFKP